MSDYDKTKKDITERKKTQYTVVVDMMVENVMILWQS